MSKRVSLTLDENMLKKVHTIQAKKIRKTGNSVSLSEVMMELLNKALK